MAGGCARKPRTAPVAAAARRTPPAPRSEGGAEASVEPGNPSRDGIRRRRPGSVIRVAAARASTAGGIARRLQGRVPRRGAPPEEGSSTARSSRRRRGSTWRGDRVTFTFGPAHKTLRAQLEQSRAWLEKLALARSRRQESDRASASRGRAGSASFAAARTDTTTADPARDRADDAESARAENEGVQAMLDVFGGRDRRTSRRCR